MELAEEDKNDNNDFHVGRWGFVTKALGMEIVFHATTHNDAADDDDDDDGR
jgi:hypothetical protein